MRAHVLAAALLLAVAPAACGGRTEGGARSDKPATSAAEAEICKEHGLLRVICPKCNPRLAAVFQAKGDWCAEHGLPESVCPICHPERGGKPAVDVATKGGAKGESDAPADGTKVRFKRKDIARLAGIKTTPAEERKGGGGVQALVKIVYDATRLAHVNARAPGVVRGLFVDVGARVKKGAALATIESADVGADRSRLQATRSRVAVAEKNFERAESLQKEGIGSAKDLLEARKELDAARGEQAALISALSVIGATGGSGGSYTLSSPLDGVVTQRAVTIGKLVGIEGLLFEVVDTSAMWADLDVAEGDIALVKQDQAVTIRIDGLEGRVLEGKINYVSPEVDLHTRTVRARVPLANPDGALRANMFGQARVLAPERTTVMVPAAAVQRAKGVQLVFVRRAEDEFEARWVELGIRDDNLVEITKGVRAGEDVATEGSFLLKTETLKESIGAGCCDSN